MNGRKLKNEESMLRHLGLFKTPPPEQMMLTEKRIQHRLRTTPITDELPDTGGSSRPHSRFVRLALVFGGAAASVLVFGLLLRSPEQSKLFAIVQSGTLWRSEPSQVLKTGDLIEAGQTVRTNDTDSAIELADGSLVDVRPQSQLSIDRAEDGVRIHLKRGTVAVKAVKQFPGRLRVITKDVSVSVVGTIFLVSVEEAGSHVSVLEGEVRVEFGIIQRTLLAGEHFSTDVKMEALVVEKNRSWSPEAKKKLALLEQPAPVEGSERQAPSEMRIAFDVASIRPGAPFQLPAGGSRGVPPEDARRPSVTGLDPALVNALTCGGPGSELNVDPGRMMVKNGTVYRLIVLAYGLKDCILSLQMGLVDGGPEWVQTDRFDIEATIPVGSPSYTRQQLMNAEAPRLQAMIQTLLAERFNLVLERETKEMPAYNLVVARAGRIKLSDDQTSPPPMTPGTPLRANALPRGVMLNCMGTAISISALSGCLQKSAGGTIMDKTGLKGLYDIPVSVPVSTQPDLLVKQILDSVGLKLEPTKAPAEILKIKRISRPTEN